MTYSFMSCSHSTFHLLEKLLLRANLRWCPKKSPRMATRPQRSSANSVFWKKSKLPLRSRKFITHFTKTTYFSPLEPKLITQQPKFSCTVLTIIYSRLDTRKRFDTLIGNAAPLETGSGKRCHITLEQRYKGSCARLMKAAIRPLLLVHT